MTSKLPLTHLALLFSVLAAGCSGAIGPLGVDDLSDAGRSTAGPDATPGQKPPSPTPFDAGRQTSSGDDAARPSSSGPDAADPGPTPVTPSAPDPFAVAPRCTSGTMWTSGTKGSGQMQPGEACIACHSKGEGPRFAFGGTVYPSGHEPSQCDGVDGNRSAVQVVVSDATGRSINATPNAAGNFYSTGRQTLTPPLRAKVVYMGRERTMVMAVPTGDCNSCHTQNGSTGAGTLKAPGRVLLP